MQIKIFETNGWKDYELLDTGGGEKLERVGKYIFSRPYDGAFWERSNEWKVDGRFANGKWQIKKDVPKSWPVEYKGIKFLAQPTPFRHFGFFPEQAAHWDFIESQIQGTKRPVKFLNLFGYTGIASLFALRAGAEVTHVDASKQSIDWVKENQQLSGLENLPLRVIVDDALKFLEREVRRGNKYDAIILDPPKFGRGPKGEVWKVEEDMAKLLTKLRSLLSSAPLFVILTSYATDSSSLTLGYALEQALEQVGGRVECGELCLREKSKKRLISLANTAVWQPL